MGLFSKLKKIHKKVTGATIGKALKKDPLGKALLKKDPLGKKLLSHATGGGTDAALGMGGGKKVGRLAQAMLAHKARSAGQQALPMAPQIMPQGGPVGPAPMVMPAVIPNMPPEMGGGADPMYSNIDQTTGLTMGGPPAMTTGGGMQPEVMGPPPGVNAGIVPPQTGPMAGPPRTGPDMGMAPRPPMGGGMGRGGLLRRRLALGGGPAAPAGGVVP